MLSKKIFLNGALCFQRCSRKGSILKCDKAMFVTQQSNIKMLN